MYLVWYKGDTVSIIMPISGHYAIQCHLVSRSLIVVLEAARCRASPHLL